MRAVLALMAVATAGSVLAGQAPPAAADLASRIQAHYATVRDFTADFTLTQTTGLMLGGAVDRGRVAIRKPGRMHWTFVTGNKSEVVADGVQIYAYFPQDKYVQVTPFPKDDQASTALLLLAGRGNLTRDFVASLPANQPAGEWDVTLTPRAPHADFSTVTIAVDRTTFGLLGMTVVDDQGGSQVFRFARLRENQGVPDSEFAFTPPRGVVIRR